MASVSISFAEDTNGARYQVGDVEVRRGTVTIAGTYTSTKVPVTAADFGLGVIEDIVLDTVKVDGSVQTIGTYLEPFYVPASNYIILTEDGREVAATFDTDGGTFRARVYGR